MSKSDLLKLLESTPLEDLKSLVVKKEKLEILLKERSDIKNDLASVSREIASIQGVPQASGQEKRSNLNRAFAQVKGKPAPAARKNARRKKLDQPSMQSLILDILAEKNKPLSVNEIGDILLAEKKYRTRSSNFKNQLRVLLYRNKKGLFRKTGAGEFGLNKPSPVRAAVQKKAMPDAAVPTPKNRTVPDPKKSTPQRKPVAPMKPAPRKPNPKPKTTASTAQRRKS
jgi:hypothetical protein